MNTGFVPIGYYVCAELPGAIWYHTLPPGWPDITIPKPSTRLTAAQKRRWREGADRKARLMYAAIGFAEQEENLPG